MPQGRVGDGVHRGGKEGNSNVVGGFPLGKKVTGTGQGPAPKGHPPSGGAIPSDPQAAAKHGENLAKQNDGNAG